MLTAQLENLIEDMIAEHNAEKHNWASSLTDKYQREEWLDFLSKPGAERAKYHREWAIRTLKRDGVIPE